MKVEKSGWRVTALAGVLVLAATPWLIAGGPPGETLPDAGRQRQVMIAELQKLNEQSAQTNKLLTEIRDVLKAAQPATPPAAGMP